MSLVVQDTKNDFETFDFKLIVTVKRPKFGNGPLVPELLKNHISAGIEVSNLVQRGKRLYIFF